MESSPKSGSEWRMKYLLSFILSALLMAACGRGQSTWKNPGENSSGQVRRPDVVVSHQAPVTAISLSAGGLLAVAGEDGAIQVYDVNAGVRGVARLAQTLKETAPVRAVGFNGTNVLLSLLRDGTANIWNIAWGGVHHTAKLNFGARFSAVISPTNEWSVAAASQRQVWLYDDYTGKRTHDFEVDDSDVAAMAFTPDGKRLVIGSVKGVVRVIDVAAWKVARMIDLDTPIYSIAASEKRIAVGYGDGSVAVLSMSDEDSVPEVNHPPGPIGAVAFSPDGQTFASGSANGSVKIWDSRTLKPLDALEGSGRAVQAVVFSPDGKGLASCDAGGSVNYWKLPRRR